MLKEFTPLLVLLGLAASCRSTNPVRSDDGKVPFDRVSEDSQLSWRIVKSDAVTRKALRADDLYELMEKLLEESDAACWDPKVARTSRMNIRNKEAYLPTQGDYGGVYLLQVIEHEAPPAAAAANGAAANGAPANGAPANGAPANGAPANGAPANGAPANGAPANGAPANGALVGATNGELIRNTAIILDDRDKANAVGAEVGLLFVPELDASLTSTVVSLYPFRLWAIDSNSGPSMAWLADQFSIDAGIVGASAIGDPPGELDGRTAFTFGCGYSLAKGWSIKAGWILYRDKLRDDELASSGYFGITYDLLNGLSKDSSKQ